MKIINKKKIFNRNRLKFKNKKLNNLKKKLNLILLKKIKKLKNQCKKERKKNQEKIEFIHKSILIVQ